MNLIQKDKMLIKTAFFSSILFVFGCVQTNQKIEDPLEVAKNYCSCVEEELKKSNDSLINIYDCEKKVFPKSRLMQIDMSFDANPVDSKYSDLTLDSARKFSLQVGNITDTMCINKIDPNRIKKLPHIKM